MSHSRGGVKWPKSHVGENCTQAAASAAECDGGGLLALQAELLRNPTVQHARNRARVDQQIELFEWTDGTVGNHLISLAQLERQRIRSVRARHAGVDEAEQQGEGHCRVSTLHRTSWAHWDSHSGFGAGVEEVPGERSGRDDALLRRKWARSSTADQVTIREAPLSLGCALMCRRRS